MKKFSILALAALSLFSCPMFAGEGEEAEDTASVESPVETPVSFNDEESKENFITFNDDEEEADAYALNDDEEEADAYLALNDGEEEDAASA